MLSAGAMGFGCVQAGLLAQLPNGRVGQEGGINTYGKEVTSHTISNPNVCGYL